MNKSMMIHETVLKDILDIFDDIRDLSKTDLDGFINRVKDRKTNPMRGMSSIAKASSNLTLVFPVICSRGIAIETSSMVSKAIEKNAVTMLQRLFAAYRFADEDNLVDYIHKFHNNISSGAASLDDIFKAMDTIDSMMESVNSYERANINNDMRNINFYLPDSISESSLSRFTIKEGAAFEDMMSDFVDTLKNTIKSNASVNASKAAKDLADVNKNKAEFFNKQVLNNEFKKANELMPTTMVVNFKVKGDNGEIHDYDNALVAVKAKLYPIGSEDIVKHLADKTIDRNWLTNFFRASTREISFMKDFVLAIDKAKIDAMSLSTRRSTSDKMWKVLERRATNSRLKKIMHGNNSAAAITTLCISQEEVEYIRKYYNIDIERVNTILGLFESLNLMCVCIVDEALEVAKFIYDENEPMWETISFTHLERESSDNTYKRVVNLMTKVSR